MCIRTYIYVSKSLSGSLWNNWACGVKNESWNLQQNPMRWGLEVRTYLLLSTMQYVQYNHLVLN